MSTVTGATAASEIAEAFLAGMNTFTAQMKESAKSQLSLTEDDKLDKPVPGILILEPDMGHKITVSAFLVWLKSVEEAWGKVSAKVPQVIAKLRGNLRIDEEDLKKMLTEKVNQRLYISLIDKVGGTLKETVWPSQKHDGVGYLFAVLKVAVEPDEREWSKRSAAFFEIPEILAVHHNFLEQAFLKWLKSATEVIYSIRFTAESVKENLGQFLRHFPDLIAAVEKIWQGSAKDYEVIQQIFVQLKKEVAEATLRMSKANKYSWGQATADHEENGQPKGKGKGKGGKGRRGSGTDAEKEPKKEDLRQRPASETDISEAWKKQTPRKCWLYHQTGTCNFGTKCRFDHDEPRRTGRGPNSTQQSQSHQAPKIKEGAVRLVNDEEDEWSGEDEDDQDELARLRKEVVS